MSGTSFVLLQLQFSIQACKHGVVLFGVIVSHDIFGARSWREKYTLGF